jgi:membrane protease YdiL (CAAX protease family)
MKITRPVAVYYLLTFLLLALVPILSAVFGLSMDFDQVASRASEQSGIPWTSNLIDVIRLALIEPGLWLLIFGAAVPTLAAVLVLLGMRDRAGFITLLKRFNPLGLRRTPIGRAIGGYLLLIAGMLICLAITNWIRDVMGYGYERGDLRISPAVLLAILFSALLDQGAILEEVGWRGYATATLQNIGNNPLAVAIVVGIAWSAWHIPRDVVTGLIESLGPVDYLLLYLPAFTLGTVTVSIIASFFMNRLGGTVIAAILVHGLANDAYGVSGQATIDQALTPGHQITKALPFLTFAILLIIWRGSGLDYSEK